MNKQINASKFHMWRGCVATMFLDGKIDDKEKSFIFDRMNSLPFSVEQREILKHDIEKGVEIDEIFDSITEKADRAFLLHQVRVISHLDGVFSKEEQEAYSRLEKKILSKIDIKKAEEEVAKMELDSYHEKNVYKNQNRHSIIESVVNDFRKVMNKGEYKFPDKN